ncbi:hemerythrin domain-containing protein [Micromonospora olivasterospora]|uniref:Hemerythrin HHE cation binding domain-containing protein n=1 Tax=Micromonospora olivasterospora TaxID=1880 RepID=A0A562I501_MICOL|nr:hemerythrin domain-containing protein [Micromonospora olivasterospora]TWH65795.1 hemerythrin HHE cation binding domain-containing protein [Micromonospora olivasterospora]
MHPSPEPADRLLALGHQLIEIHLWLREELARLRESLDPGADPDRGALRSLRAHCLTFCAALTRHHTGEDAGAFRVLAEEAPELRPVLDELARDHRIVDGIVRRVEELVADPPGGDPAATDRVRAELDGLGALLGSHFTYEERKLVGALDALRGRAGDTEKLFGVAPPAW